MGRARLHSHHHDNFSRWKDDVWQKKQKEVGPSDSQKVWGQFWSRTADDPVSPICQCFFHLFISKALLGVKKFTFSEMEKKDLPHPQWEFIAPLLRHFFCCQYLLANSLNNVQVTWPTASKLVPSLTQQIQTNSKWLSGIFPPVWNALNAFSWVLIQVQRCAYWSAHTRSHTHTCM